MKQLAGCHHLPTYAFWQLLVELEQSAALSQQQITAVKQQIAVKGRESRMLQLTKGEVESLPKNTNVYEGVGKMCGPNLIIASVGNVKY